jgi:hypothetical protein
VPETIQPRGIQAGTDEDHAGPGCDATARIAEEREQDVPTLAAAEAFDRDADGLSYARRSVSSESEDVGEILFRIELGEALNGSYRYPRQRRRLEVACIPAGNVDSGLAEVSLRQHANPKTGIQEGAFGRRRGEGGRVRQKALHGRGAYPRQGRRVRQAFGDLDVGGG